jgi:acyl-CoA carboxylase epsilon subunit
MSDPTSDSTNPEDTPPPLLRIVKGDPGPEEVAALVAVVSALAAGAAEAASKQKQPRSEWSAHHRKMRPPHRHGAGAWRSSAR